MSVFSFQKQAKNITKILLVFVIFLSCPLKNAICDETSNKYSLSDLYGIALQKSEKIHISQAQLEIAEQYKTKALSVLLPRLSAFSEYSRYWKETIIVPKWQARWGLNLSQSFTLNGKELIYYRITEKSVEKSSYELIAVKEEHLFDIASYYYDVLKAIKGIEIARANLERLMTYKEAVATRLKLEDVPKTDMFRTEAELSGSKTDLVKAQNGLKFVMTYLAGLVGIWDAFDILEPEMNLQSPQENIEELKTAALKKRPEMIALKIQEQIMNDQIAISKSDYWPALAFDAVVYDNDDRLHTNTDWNAAGTVKLNMTLFDWGLRKASYQEALVQKRQATLQVEAMVKRVIVEVEQAYLDMVTQQSLLASLEDQVKYAKENFEAVEKQFKFGLANSVDVIDANTLLVTSERKLSDAQYGYQLAILKLEKANGIFIDRALDSIQQKK